ncbi:MAG: cobyrinate a,c-diamide synthase [Oscillospiraceae bacterium]|nr:cobyrinate a,c-diamide synthase [Oscillospiraceae bacterium]
MKRFMIAGTNSGCGKTSVVCAVLKALVNRNINPVSFKCGCDYIDPMFHREIIGIESHNLDSFFCDDNTLKYLFARNSKGDISVAEGVMGFYDGINGKASSCEISQKLNIPVVIVIDCKGMSTSIGAVMKGFLEYRNPNNIKGFIFNRLPESLKDYVESLCRELDTEFFGYLPYCRNAVIESRYLGLSADTGKIREKLDILGNTAEKTIDISKLASLSDNMDFPESDDINIKKICSLKIAVARDKAFSFIYQDNIDILERLGCEIKYFSPLDDEKLPEDVSGIILSGGYPELYAEKLSRNKSMLSDIKSAFDKNIPIIAECGGFIYLHELIGEYRGVGIICGKAFKTEKLQRFGYINITANKNNLLCNKGESIKAHEFHYWESTDCGNDFRAVKPSNGKAWECIHSGENYYIGFPHIYFYSNPEVAINFVRKCKEYHEKN